jgi:2-C-methyl-D-erythritol 2,4-cyclodiphosphate synthase
MTFRIGTGFDVHAFAENRKLVLGGIEIPFNKGLAGHSDADVLVHALCDALLGAAALGDIGTHFPDTDEKYKDISSLSLLQKVNKMLKKAGYQIGNVDGVIIARQPKLSPFIPEMRKVLTETLQVEINRISVKATTTEHLGFTGRGEGIAAMASVLLEKGGDG